MPLSPSSNISLNIVQRCERQLHNPGPCSLIPPVVGFQSTDFYENYQFVHKKLSGNTADFFFKKTYKYGGGGKVGLESTPPLQALVAIYVWFLKFFCEHTWLFPELLQQHTAVVIVVQSVLSVTTFRSFSCFCFYEHGWLALFHDIISLRRLLLHSRTRLESWHYLLFILMNQRQELCISFYQISEKLVKIRETQLTLLTLWTLGWEILEVHALWQCNTKRQSAVKLRFPLAWKESSVGAGCCPPPLPPCENHNFTGLPSADIAAFNLQRKGSCWAPLHFGGSVKVEHGIEMLWRARSMEDLAVVFEHDSRYASLMAVDWQQISGRLSWFDSFLPPSRRLCARPHWFVCLFVR